MNRILDLCMRPRAMGNASPDATGLMEEVSVDYLRTMSKIVLEAQTKEVSVPALVETARG